MQKAKGSAKQEFVAESIKTIEMHSYILMSSLGDSFIVVISV